MAAFLYSFPMQNRIKELRKSKGWTQTQLAEACDTSLTMIQYVENGQRGLTEKWMDLISKALGVEPWELITDKINTKELRPVPVIGEVQAGVWKEAVQWEPGDYRYVEMTISAVYRPYAYGLIVRGDSMNLKYQEGFTLVVVPLENYQKDLETGRIVIVERTKKDGTVEATAKELRIIDGHAELWCLSTNPKYKGPLAIHWPHEEPEKSGTETVEIKGVVINFMGVEE